MVYVNEVSVDTYKGLCNISVSNLSPITIVTGPNGCGKSSFLEATEILLNPFDFSHYVSVTGNSPDGLSHSFHKKKMRPYTKISGKILNQAYFTEIVSYQPISKGSFQGFHHCGYPKENALQIKSNEINFSFFDDTFKKVSPPLVRYKKITPNDRKLSLEQIASDSLIREKVLSYLSLYDGDYEAFITEDFQETYLSHKSYGTIDQSFFSDGIRYFLKISEQLANFTNGVVFIDPVENQLSPNSFPVLVELLYHLASKRRLQLFLSTQSLEMIDEWLDLLHFYRQLPIVTILTLQSKPNGCNVTRYSGELSYQLRMESQTDFRFTQSE